MEPSPSASGGRRRILFVAEAASLAHVGRPAALARTLDPARDEAVFAVHRRCWPLLDGLRARLVHLDSAEPAAFARALAAGRPVFEAATLDRYVADDLALLAAERPDVVVGDFRLSLAVSARLLRVPYLALASAYWSPWARLHPCPAPVVAPLRPFGRLATLLAPFAMPLGMAAHARVFAALARRHRLRPAAHGLRGAYTDGDLTGYCDPPGWIALTGAPGSHRCLGAPLWEPPVAAPGWLAEFTRTPGWIYVTLGSTGDPALLPAVLAVTEVRNRILALVATEALQPGALGELSGIRAFIRTEIRQASTEVAAELRREAERERQPT
ncbi:MAG: glycosyl transferase family 1 [Planctomycetes bacterium]|nr:glycosyl transferase family 1 [Planctomycetota bacterium]